MSEEAGKVNNYICQACGGRIVTVNRVKGTTPFMVLCRVKDGCKGVMQSALYRCDQSETPTHEWFKPSLKEAARQGKDMLNHVRDGGLDLRPIVSVPGDSLLTVGIGWDTYMARVTPRGAPQVQIQETRRAFFAGAAWMMGLLDAIATDAVSEDGGVEILERLHEELRAYVATVGTPLESAS